MSFLGKIPVVGSLFNDDEERFNKAMDRMKAAYEQYRPQIEQAQMRGLNQSLGAFDQSVNPMLVGAYGPSAAINTGLLGQNPLHPLPAGGPPPMDNPQAPTYGAAMSGAPPEEQPGGVTSDIYQSPPPRTKTTATARRY